MNRGYIIETRYVIRQYIKLIADRRCNENLHNMVFCYVRLLQIGLKYLLNAGGKIRNTSMRHFENPSKHFNL